MKRVVMSVLVGIAFAGAVHAQRFLLYEPETVELDGRLVSQSKYGPPNYGENPKTDQKVTVPVLLLRNPVSLIGKSNDANVHNAQSVSNVRQIQLVFNGAAKDYRNLIGKQVVVTGMLFHAHTGHHYTDVLIKVASIERKPVGYDQRPFAVCGIITSYYKPKERFSTSNYLEGEFRALFAGEPTEKSYKLEGTDRIINATFDYADYNGSREGKPHELVVAIILSDKEEDALDALGHARATTKYTRGWRLSVMHEVLVGETWHRMTLSCSDGNSRKSK